MLTGRELATLRKQLLGWFRQFQRALPCRRTKDALALPGIGNYTAAAILSIAFGEKHAVLDGNVARVLARLGAIRGDLRESRQWQELQKTADRLLESKSPGDWNQAMMELGATLCTPKSPQCLLCPIAPFCAGRKLGVAESLPEKRKKRATVEVILAAAVFTDAKGQTLLRPPPKNTKEKAASDHVPTMVSKLWHFPTLSVTGEPAKNLIAFLRRLMPRVQNRKWQLVPAGQVRHAVTYRAVTVLPFLIEVNNLPRFPGARQVPLSDISSLPISNLTRKVARAALAAAASAPARR